MKFKENKIEWEYNGFFNFKKLTVNYETFEGETKVANVEYFDRGDSAAILIFERDTNSILLTEQFRYPTTKNDSGWLEEIVAGRIEDSETPENSIKREIEEEIGYEVSKVTSIGNYYLSPGGTTERIFLFYAEVNKANKTLQGGGKLEENENIKLIKRTPLEMKENLNSNKIKDAKTAIAISWFVTNKMNTRGNNI